MRPLLLLLVLLSAVPVGAQTFDAFVRRVESTPYLQRSAVVDSFLAAVPSVPYIDGNTVHFLWRGAASSVQVAGDLNDWSPSRAPMAKISSTDLWHYARPFEPTARIDYKLVLNGSTWVLDPRNPRQVPGGFGPNSELAMPGYVPAPELVARPGVARGTVGSTRTIQSAALGASRSYRVYTPPGYDAAPTDSFAVVLVHDGFDYLNLASAATVLDNLIADRRIRPMVAVFVPAASDGNLRHEEYAASRQAAFTAFVLTELMPTIDRDYRTKRNPTERGVIGASDGGNISLWLGLSHPEQFGKVAAFSSNVEQNIQNGFSTGPTLPLEIFMDLGLYDLTVLLPRVRGLVPVLRDKGYPLTYTEWAEGHSWGSWRAHLDNGLEALFPGSALTHATDRATDQPTGFRLDPASPNPFNPTTTIRYHLTSAGLVQLRVFDTLGHRVRTLVDGVQTAGAHTATFNAEGLNSGLYLIHLTVAGRTRTRSVTLVR